MRSLTVSRNIDAAIANPSEPMRALAAALACAVFVVCACLFAAVPQAHASSDVKFVKEDTLVYRGGYYDFEVAPVGFTAQSYKWYLKYGGGSWTHDESLNDTLDGEEDPTWFSGFNTSHLRLCTNNFVNDSDPDDWGAMEFYCVVTDTSGKKHYSDKKHMVIKGTDSFNTKYAQQEAAGYGLAFASASPAQDSGIWTKVSMKVGESKTFNFTVKDGVSSWLSESDPIIKTRIEILSSDGTHTTKQGVSSYSFTPGAAGEYLVYMGANLQLGYSYDTGKSIGHYYRVTVTKPDATEPAPTDPDATEPEPTLTTIKEVNKDSRLTISSPWTAGQTPAVGATIPESQFTMTYANLTHSRLKRAVAIWYKRVGLSYIACADLDETTFKAGASYQLRVRLFAADNYRFETDPSCSRTSLTTGGELEAGTSVGGKTYMPLRSNVEWLAEYAVRSFTMPDEAEPQNVAKYKKPDGTYAQSEFVEIDGKTYYFDSDGYLAKGWQTIGGKLYYFDSDGKLVSGKDGVTALGKASVKLSATSYTYDGAAKKPTATVTLYGRTLKAGTDYTISYSGNKNAGAAKATVTGKGSFGGSAAASFTIAKAKATAKAKKATVSLKASKLKKKAQKVANLTVTCDKGKATYKNVSKNKTAKKFKVAKKTGKLTVPKGTKAGTYTVKVKVKVKSGANYKKLTKTVSFKVKVKGASSSLRAA